MPGAAPLHDPSSVLRGLGLDDIPATDVMAKRRAEVRLTSVMAEGAEPRTRRRFTPAANIALVLVIIGAWIVVSTWGHGAPTAAATALGGLSEVAESRGSLPVLEGWFVHARSEGTVLLTGQDLGSGRVWRALVPISRETWIAQDGSGRLIESAGQPTFVSPQDAEAWRAAGSPVLAGAGEITRERHGPGGLFLADPASIPDDVEELLRRIQERTIVSGPPGDASSLRIVASLLRDSFLSPSQRAAAFQAAARLTSIELVGDVIDHAGRVGVAVRATDDQGSVELVFDPVTSLLLEERLTEAGAPAITTWTTYVELDLARSPHSP